MIAPGSVFQLTGDDNHPRIVLSNPLGKPPRVLICNLSDLDKHPDCPCRFYPADHAWCTKDSAIPFRFITTVPLEGFDPAIKFGRIIVSPDLIHASKLKELCEAILSATSIPEKWKIYLR